MDNISTINNNIQIKHSEPKYINQNDFIYFKNELLKDLKSIESKILSKVNTSQEDFHTKILNINSKVTALNTKIFELSSNMSSEKSDTEKLNKLITSKTISEDKIALHEKKIKELTDYLNQSIYSMNKLLQETINCPGIIGLNSKFVSFQAFAEHVLNNINNINSFKEKMMALDISNYKSKLDKVMKSYKVQMDSFMSSTRNLTTETLVIFDNKVNEILRLFEEKISQEKNDIKNDINLVDNKFGKVNDIIHDLKSELSNKIGSHDFENERKFANINLKFDKNLCDIESMNKKTDEINENIQKICLSYEERMKEQENKLLKKINDLYIIIRDNVISKDNIKNKNNISLKKFERDFDKDIHTFKPLEPGVPIRDPGSVESKLKKYIEGEISAHEFTSSKEKKNLKGQNSNNQNSNENEKYRNNNINKILESESFPYINNIKFIKFENEVIKNNQENYENKLFLNRKKVDSYIIEKENVRINRIPRQQIIKNLLQGSSESMPYYHIKSKEDKTNHMNKIQSNSKKKIASIKSGFLTKHKGDSNNSFKKFLHKSTSQFYNIKKLNLINNDIDNGGVDDTAEINKRTFSSAQSKTRNNSQNSIMAFNTTDIIKDTKAKDNEERKNDKNSEIFIQDENPNDIEYIKKKNKILNNFNSASKLFDINVQSDNNLLLKTKYKIKNPLYKNIKIFKKENKGINTQKEKDKEKEKNNNIKPAIHHYFNIKNNNK